MGGQVWRAGGLRATQEGVGAGPFQVRSASASASRTAQVSWQYRPGRNRNVVRWTAGAAVRLAGPAKSSSMPGRVREPLCGRIRTQKRLADSGQSCLRLPKL